MFSHGLNQRVAWSDQRDTRERGTTTFRNRGRRTGGSSRWNNLQKFVHPSAVGVAMRNQIFSEGAERMVSKFREFDENYNFVGPWMVAKQSRFIEDENDADQRRFHQFFCSTQQTAERIAQKFNERLATIPGVTAATPRVKFLDCGVYVLDDALLGVTGVLVEKMLDTTKLTWKKWNSNNGYVDGMKHSPGAVRDTPDARVEPDVVDPMALGLGALSLNQNLKLQPSWLQPAPLTTPGLGAIAEDDEEEEEEEEEESESAEEALGEDSRDLARATASDRRVGVEFTIADMPQAFSCFSHKYSSRR